MKKLTAIVTLVTFLITGQAWGLSPELRTMQVQFRPGYNDQMAKVIRELTKKEHISEQGLQDIFKKYDIDPQILEISALNDPIWSDPRIDELRQDIEMNGKKNFKLSKERVGGNELYKHPNGLAVVKKHIFSGEVNIAQLLRKFFKERANEYCVPTFFSPKKDKKYEATVYELYLGDDMGYRTVYDVAERFIEKDKELLRDAIRKTFGRGWYHTHLHKSNILVKYDNQEGIQDIKFIRLTAKYFKEQLDGKFRRIKLMYVTGEKDGKPYSELTELPFKLEVTTAGNVVMVDIISRFENYMEDRQIGTIDFQVKDDKICNLCVTVENDYEPVKAWALEEVKKLISYDLDIHNSYRVDSDPVSNSREGYNWKIALGDTLKMLRYLNESLKSAKEFKIPTTILFDTHWMKKTPHLDREKNRLISSLRKHCEKHGVEFVSWDMMKCRQISIGKGKRNLIVIADKECPQVKIEGDRENIRQYYFKIDGQAITNTPVKDGFEFYEPVFEIVTAALRETVVKQFVRRDTRYFTIEKGEDGTYTITLIPMEPVNCEELRKIYDMQIFA